MNSDVLHGLIEDIEIKQIRPAANTLRSGLGNLDELCKSISEKGLLHPIVVRPVGGVFEVVGGMRRLSACRKVGLKRIPCHVVNLDEREAFEVSLIENIQRETLDPAEEARAFERYVNQYGYGSVSELGRRIGKSEEYVSQRLRLLQLPGDILEKVSRRLITASHATELVGLREEEQLLLTSMVATERLSSKEVRKIAKHLKRDPQLHDAAFDLRVERSGEEKRLDSIFRNLDKCITLMKMTLISFDDIFNRVGDDDWMIKEELLSHRTVLHEEIDRLIKFEKKTRRASHGPRNLAG